MANEGKWRASGARTKGQPRAKDTLRKLNVRPSKERGQNFLIDTAVPEAIVEFGAPPPAAEIVEIGPGTGALTRQLANWQHLTVIEIESRFCNPLQQQFPHIRVVNADVRGVDISSLTENGAYVFGNIPYSFSTDIVFHLLRHRLRVVWAVLMVQKEFAERVAATCGSRTYGSISVAVQLWADIELGPVVPGSSFHPPTAVDSQVMKIIFRKEPRVAVSDAARFERLVRGSFSQRRKKLTNSLASTGLWSREEIENALGVLGIRVDARPEQLSVQDFGRLSAQLR